MFDSAPESFKNLIRCLLVEMIFFFGLSKRSGFVQDFLVMIFFRCILVYFVHV